MAVIDLIILGVLAVSTLISLWRGFIREALSLVIWVAAFFVARMFSGNLAVLLGGFVETNSLRWLISFAILFLGTVVVGTMLNFLLSNLFMLPAWLGSIGLWGWYSDLFAGWLFWLRLFTVLSLPLLYKTTGGNNRYLFHFCLLWQIGRKKLYLVRLGSFTKFLISLR